MVNNSDTKVSYQGNGQTTVFPFSFPFIQRDYIKVAIYDSLTDETKTIDSDYYVDTVANAVIYPGYEPGQEPAEALRPPILPATSTITIYRQTDVDQLTDLGEKYPLKDIENMADKLTEIIQEQAETLGRTVKVPVGDPKTPEEKLTDLQNYVTAAADSAADAADSEASAQRAAEAAATSEANAAESERLAGGYADTATDAASRAEDSAISARAYNAPDYDNAVTYQVGDVVTYIDGNSYRALQETTGNEPPNIIYWQRVTDYVGDDFFEIDEYGYIVPMDSPSHSRYWRVDQNGYIVPLEGGDGGYRPDTRQLSAEYLNVTNEGYIKHLRADDIAAQEVDADEVTAEVAAFNSLTANAVNAQSVVADDIIAKGPIVDVRAFGAVGDGVHDDTTAIQAAIDSLVDTQAKGVVLIPTGKYVINSKLEIDVAYVSIKANGATIDASNITSGEALHVYGSYYPPFYQSMNYLEGFELVGADRNTDTIGILFDSTTGSTSHTNCFKININKFKTGIVFGSHAYVQNFIGCDVSDCKTCVLMPTGYTDYGERLSFIGCTLYNSNNAIEINNASGAFFITQTSIDYTQHVATVTAGVLFLTDCHIESSYWGTGDYNGVSPFIVANNTGASLTVEGGILLNTASTVGYSSIIDNQNANQYNKVQASFTNVFIHNIKIIDAFSSGNGITKVEGTKTFTTTDFPYIVSEQNNLMANGDFADGTINDRIYITADTAAISGETLIGTNIKLTTSNEYAYKSDYSLKATKTYGGGSPATFTILCPIKPYLLTTFSFMLYTPNGMPGEFWVAATYYKIDGSYRSGKGIGSLNLGGQSAFNDGFKRVAIVTANNLAAPSWATHIGVELNLNAVSSTAIYVDDIIVNQA